MGILGFILAVPAAILSVLATFVGFLIFVVVLSALFTAWACWVDYADVSTLLQGKQPGAEEEKGDVEALKKEANGLNGDGEEGSSKATDRLIGGDTSEGRQQNMDNHCSKNALWEEGFSFEQSSPPVAVIMPALNESLSIGTTLKRLGSLRPAAALVVVADGGSTDGTPEIAERMGAVVVRCKEKGRAKQMNAGAHEAAKRLGLKWHTSGTPGPSEDEFVAGAGQIRGGGDVEQAEYDERGGGVLYSGEVMGKEALAARDSGGSSPLFCFVHADTIVPIDFVRTVRHHLAEEGNSGIGFVPLIAVPGRIFWALSTLEVAKTWICAAAQSPVGFLKGLRTLYGDQAISCRAADFWSIKGFDEDLPILEDTDFCERLHRRYMASGASCQIALVPRVVVTSGRRFLKRGVLKSVWINLKFAWAYLVGASPAQFHSMYVSMYKDVR